MANYYSLNADKFAKLYEGVAPQEIHGNWLHLIPNAKSVILDIGAGSGRDAAWFAKQGHEVLAVEPSDALREKAQRLHTSPSIQWLNDKLPSLKAVYNTGIKFDLILLSAVWFHVSPNHRERSFRKLTNLLKPGGKLIISLRHGPAPDDGRVIYPCNTQELKNLSNNHMLEIVLETTNDDKMGRSDISWSTIVFQLPDDGTGALPLLRHVIINDAKSSSYKLALLRSILRIADGAQGMVLDRNKSFVTLPFGIIALYWVKMFKTLVLDHKLPQQPSGSGNLSFAIDAFFSLKDISPYDLRIGARFEGDSAKNLMLAMREARNTIKKMPAVYTTYPGKDDPVFICNSSRVHISDSVQLNQAFFEKFGTIKIPLNLWDSLSRYACWVEPAIINEWCSLMAAYDSKCGKKRPYDEYLGSLKWLDETRDTQEVRKIILDIMAKSKAVYCVWTGARLKYSFDVDHCLPFSHWPNNDLWNLMPTKSQANASKSNKIPSSELLERSKNFILDWWDTAYNSEFYKERFITEANAALPRIGDFSNGFHNRVYFGLQNQRIRLKIDQQLEEWDGI